MEYRVTMTDPTADVALIETEILKEDPSAQVDLDKLQQTLRVAAQLEAADIVHVLRRLGYPVSSAQVLPIPSGCCGGCGG